MAACTSSCCPPRSPRPATTPPTASPRGTARRFDSATGLYNYRARYYNPEWGRFLSEDPLEFTSGDLNLYAYVYNDPLTYTDPTGELAPLVGACIGGAAFDALWHAGESLLTGRKLTWGGVGKAAAGGCVGGMLGFGIGKALGKAGRALGGGRGGRPNKPGTSCPNSFTGDTPVWLADGTTKPISEVLVGDEVLATDPATGDTSGRTVTDAVIGGGGKTLVDVTYHDGATVTATDDHPFYVTSTGEWTTAADLAAGDQLRTPDGDTLAVEALRTRTADYQTVHNLTVADHHTFYVGDHPVLVHNCGETSATRRGREAHQNHDYGPGFKKENPLPSGRRPDAVNFRTREVVELKPNNPRAIRQGERQVERYRKELESTYGGRWTGRVETYNP